MSGDGGAEPDPDPGPPPAGSGGDGEVTIGVAVAVPSPHGPELQRWRAEFGDPLADAIPAHVTLLPPTVVPAGQLDAARCHLRRAAAAARPFRMHLRGTGTFRPVSPVVFVQVARGLSECEQLERAVRSGPLRRRTEFAYHPHVTVAHDVGERDLDRAFDALAGYEAVFGVHGFELYEHGRDGVWRPVQTFDLGDAG